MGTTKLMILGSVRELGQAHGYRIRRDLEGKGVHIWAKIKQGSIYHGLRKLTDEGLLEVTAAATRGGAGPARTEYAITSEGESAYFALVEEALRSLSTDIGYTIAGIGCMSDLPRVRVIELLQERVAAYTAWRAEVVGPFDGTSAEEDWMHHVEAVQLWAHTADSAISWTEGLLTRLEQGAYTFADERER